MAWLQAHSPESSAELAEGVKLKHANPVQPLALRAGLTFLEFHFTQVASLWRQRLVAPCLSFPDAQVRV